METATVYANAEAVFGANDLSIEMPTYAELFKQQIAAPLFVFQVRRRSGGYTGSGPRLVSAHASRPEQVFCMVLYVLDGYFFMSLFTLAMLLVVEHSNVLQRQRNLRELRELRPPEQPVHAYRCVCSVRESCMSLSLGMRSFYG